MAVHALAQRPSSIELVKMHYYRQTAPARTEYAEGHFTVRIEFPALLPADAIVGVRKPDGSSAVVYHVIGTRIYYVDDRFTSLGDLDSAYSSGAYTVAVTGSKEDGTLSIPATFAALVPTTIANFAELQSAQGSPTVIHWSPIAKGGEQEELSWQVTNADDPNIGLNAGTLIPDPGATWYAAADIPPQFSMVGSLNYLRTTPSTTDDGRTSISVGTGFCLSFPLYRVGIKPAAPIALGAYSTGRGDTILSWQVSSTGDRPTAYRVERSTDRDFPQLGTYMDYVNGFRTSLSLQEGLIPGRFYVRLTAINEYGTSAPSEPVEVKPVAETRRGGAARMVNIATRAHCGTNARVTIGGFVVGGTQPKRVLIRAVGPTLSSQGIGPDAILQDPTMSVYREQTVVASNDDWTTNANAGEIAAVSRALGASALADMDTKSAALLIDLSPGVYSFVVNGKNATSGIVLLEVYDAESSSDSRFVNIAARAYSTAGDGVTIGGFVVTGTSSKQVLLRAIGPALKNQGIPWNEVLADPVIELHRGPQLIATNDDWSTNDNAPGIPITAARIGAFPIDENKSAALLVPLPPGVYTFLAYDRNHASGIVLVEAYDAD